VSGRGTPSDEATTDGAALRHRHHTVGDLVAELGDVGEHDLDPVGLRAPLLNERGELVGINTAIVGSAQNLGLAIAIDDAKDVIEEPLSGRGGPYLGVQLVDNSPQLAAQLGLGVTEGALIATVTPRPGLTSGLRPGDVVVAAAEAPVASAADLIAAIADTTPGAELSLVVVRGAERLDIDVVVGRRPALVD
jgi:S1-C subfamily serine protease